MRGTDKSVRYFDGPGGNTDEVLRLAKKRAEELGVEDIVVASTTGETGVKASELFKNFNVVVVTLFTGYRKPGLQVLSDDNRRLIEKNGGKIFTGTQPFTNVARAFRNKFDTAYPTEIMAQTLRLFGEGTKVAVEIATMAADAGLIPVDKEVISIGGSTIGVDTALVIQPANSARIFELVILEIIAKPRNIRWRRAEQIEIGKRITRKSVARPNDQDNPKLTAEKNKKED